MIQDDNEVMLIAKRQGILTYDGANWGSIDLPGIPQMLKLVPSTGKVLVALSGEFGSLELDNTGHYRYAPLIDSTEVGHNFTDVLLTGEHIYFYSPTAIFRQPIDLEESPVQLKDINDPMYDGAFVSGSRFFVKKSGSTLDILYEDSLISLPTKPFEENEQILFSIDLEKNRTLIGTANERLVEFNGKRFMEITPDDHAYLNEHMMSQGLELERNRYAIGTISGGCIVIDGRSGETLFTLNYRTGLPDNEVMAMCVDRNGGLWVAHELGITRVDLELPINDYSAYPGLEGNLLTSIYHNDRLFVGTSSGVFYLTKTKDKSEYLQLVQRQQEIKNRVVKANNNPETISKPRAQRVVKKPEESEALENEELNMDDLTPKQKRQLRRKLRKEKKAREKALKEGLPADPEPTETPGETQVKETIPELANRPKPSVKKPIPQNISVPTVSAKQTRMEQASSYVFKRIEGLDVKSKQFVEYGLKLLVATNTGVYEVSGVKAEPVVENAYVNHISPSHKKKNRFYVCTSSGFLTVEHFGDDWIQLPNTDSIEANVYSVAEDGSMGLWVSSDNTAWRVELNESGEAVSKKEYVFGPDFSESVQIADIGGVPHFLLPSGIFIFQEAQDRMRHVSDRELFLSGTGEYLLNGPGNNWYFNGVKWQPLAESNSLGNARFLELFDDPRNIHRDKKGNLWVVDGSQHLIRIDTKADSTVGEVFNIYIRKMMDEAGTLFSLDEALTVHKKNSLEFLISAPFYLKSDGTEYQYRLVGLKDSWSRWSPSASIEIPFIPAGVYTLEIRARNILGQITEINSISFQIEEMLWKRWYMVLLYGLILIAVVWIIVKLREKSMRDRQRELESMVKERTVELEEEKGKVEDLLLNILPKETAEELQLNGKATARHYNMVSVLFTDFKGFTKFAEQTKPEDLVSELDKCFIQFDDITSSLGLEKIKTIGDAYMCAGGVPIKNKSNPIATTLCALKLREVMRLLAEEKKANGEKPWEIRIGVHTGPLTAGVVGKKKFAYDIWGDTVNTASRMESSSEPGKVNISGITYELVKEYFDCEYRGKIDAKGKGLIDMYFVKGLKESYSKNGDRLSPNEDLTKIIAW